MRHYTMDQVPIQKSQSDPVRLNCTGLLYRYLCVLCNGWTLHVYFKIKCFKVTSLGLVNFVILNEMLRLNDHSVAFWTMQRFCMQLFQ